MLFFQMPPQFLDVFGFGGGFVGDGEGGVDVDEGSGYEALGAVEALALVVEGFWTEEGQDSIGSLCWV